MPSIYSALNGDTPAMSEQQIVDELREAGFKIVYRPKVQIETSGGGLEEIDIYDLHKRTRTGSSDNSSN